MKWQRLRDMAMNLMEIVKLYGLWQKKEPLVLFVEEWQCAHLVNVMAKVILPLPEKSDEKEAMLSGSL